MAEQADVIIIGAGIMGSATAYQLARRKYGRVIVLERDGICSGSTAMASGGVRHQYAHRIGIQLTQQSIVVYENFEAEFGVDPQFHQNGYLILQQTEEERMVYFRHSCKVFNGEVMTRPAHSEHTDVDPTLALMRRV